MGRARLRSASFGDDRRCPPRPTRWPAILVAAVVIAGCGRPTRQVGASGPTGGTVPPGQATASSGLPPEARARVERFCGDCHALPTPASFPRESWPREVRQGFDFYLASLRTDLPRPPEGEAIRFFQETAPERVAVPMAAEREEIPAPVRFQPLDDLAGADLVDPAIAQVLALPLRGAAGSGLDLLTTDMRSGEIRRWRLTGGGAEGTVLGRLSHPCRISPVAAGIPLGGGTAGLFVADLGSFLPEDHAAGGVFLVPGTAGEAPAEPLPVRRGLGRVVSAVPFDWDGDGRRDLIVAEFGWRASGALRVLLRAADVATLAADRPPEAFSEIVVDPRHGVLDLRIADLDGDGRDDVVAAFAQEHETVDAWFSRGEGSYEHRELVRFPDPSWGSSGIDVADLDGDGDLDILHANGDTMDSGLARPTHGIRGLFNDGEAGFRVVDIALMPGVSQARAADLDGDGDLDVVATALFPGADELPPGTFDSVLWVEQGPRGGWFPHSIERDACRYASFDLADADGDGRTDIVAGVWLMDATRESSAGLRVWLNRSTSR